MKNKKNLSLIMLGIFIVMVDRITKLLLINKEITIIPNFLNFIYTENRGVAFGIASSNTILIVLMNVIILAIIIKFLRDKFSKTNYIIILSLIMILAGGAGNLIDRIVRGYVIDFIDVNILNFPVFNVADISITLGVIMIMIILVGSLFEKEDSLKDYEKEMQEENYEIIYEDIVNKSIELVKEIIKIKGLIFPEAEETTTLLENIKSCFEEKVNCWRSVIKLMNELLEWKSDYSFIAPTEKDKLELIFLAYNRVDEILDNYKKIKKEIEAKSFETILEDRKEKIIELYTEMLTYKNKTYNSNWNIEEFTPVMIHYYNFYCNEFLNLRDAVITNCVKLDNVERIIIIDDIYNMLLSTKENEGYKEFAYAYRDFDLKEGQTYEDFYNLEREKLIELFKEMLAFVGENDFANEDDYDKLKDKVIEKYPFYSSKLDSHYIIEETWIEILSDLEDAYEELSGDYKNREKNLKRYEEFKMSVPKEDEDIDFWN